MVPGRSAAVAVDAVVGIIVTEMAQSLGHRTAPVAGEKVVMGTGKIEKVAPAGVAGAPVVSDQTPAGAVKDDSGKGVPVKVAVLNGDMGCLVFLIGAVHADIDGFAVVGEGEIFNMDITAVDPHSHAAFHH